MNKRIPVFIFLLCITGLNAFAQSSPTDSLRVLFWNVENFFDCKDDSLTLDDEFTPQGERHWTLSRYIKKRNNIYKTVMACGGWSPPDVIALCEIENFDVLHELLNNTPLRKYQYGLIHKESGDRRGIDVALLYNPEKFTPFNYAFIPVVLSNGDTLKTRDILKASGTVLGGDTLHLFVNHWPSRYGGVLETKACRRSAANALRLQCDILFQSTKNAHIVIVGDFNDAPSDESLAEALKSRSPVPLPVQNELYNLSYNWSEENRGTLKFRGRWDVFDQIVVSGAVLTEEKWLVKEQSAEIMQLPFLLIPDKNNLGVKPFRTYDGYRYAGGFSDHLPVKLTLYKR